MKKSYENGKSFFKENFYKNGTLSLNKIRCFLLQLNLNHYPVCCGDFYDEIFED